MILPPDATGRFPVAERTASKRIDVPVNIQPCWRRLFAQILSEHESEIQLVNPLFG